MTADHCLQLIQMGIRVKLNTVAPRHLINTAQALASNDVRNYETCTRLRHIPDLFLHFWTERTLRPILLKSVQSQNSSYCSLNCPCINNELQKKKKQENNERHKTSEPLSLQLEDVLPSQWQSHVRSVCLSTAFDISKCAVFLQGPKL